MNVAQNAPVIPKNRDFQSSWDSTKTSALKEKIQYTKKTQKVEDLWMVFHAYGQVV